MKRNQERSFRRMLLWDNGEIKISLYLWASGTRELIAESVLQEKEMTAPWAYLHEEVKRSIPLAVAQYFEQMAREI